jgi:rod shape-determining protein MreC
MDHTPPPFFKRGPAPLVRLFFFASLSLALLVIDARFRYVDGLRSWLALAAYPIQRAATWPIDVALSIGGYFSTQANLIEENERLRAQALANVQDAQRYHALQAEATELRRMIGAAEKLRCRRRWRKCSTSGAILTRTSCSSTAAACTACVRAARWPTTPA